MKGFLKRLRGVIKTGLTWAIGWPVLFSLIMLGEIVIGRAHPSTWVLKEQLVGFVFISAIGFIAGSVFGVLLSILERHKKLEDLSLWRIALWGTVGGLALRALLGPTFYWWEFFTVVAVGSATGTVALAKRAERKLLEGEEESPLILEGEAEPLPALEGK